MKIYIASSWRNEANAIPLAGLLLSQGHEVDCFCDPSTGRPVFQWTKDVFERWNTVEIIKDPGIQEAFEVDRKWLDWAEAIVMLRPCGHSAHLEAGYAKGCGKRLIIVGPFSPGEFEVMYGFADALIDSGKDGWMDALLDELESERRAMREETPGDLTIALDALEAAGQHLREACSLLGWKHTEELPGIVQEVEELLPTLDQAAALLINGPHKATGRRLAAHVTKLATLLGRLRAK